MVRLNAQKAGSPTRFVFTADPVAEKLPVKLTVAFPEGSVFVKRGVSCRLTTDPFRPCSKRSRLGYGVANWTFRLGGAEFMCDGRVRAWNAEPWRGFVLREVFGAPGGCGPETYYDGRFEKHVLTIRFFDYTEEVEGSEAFLRFFALNVHAFAGAKVPPLRTPRRCDRRRGWKTLVTIEFRDGSKERFSQKHPCHN